MPPSILNHPVRDASTSFDKFCPKKILTIILQHLGQADLYNISLLSKTLHHLALPMHISRCNGDSYENGKLAVAYKASQILPALRTALFVTSLETVSCSINAESPIGIRLRNLERLFRRMRHVREVSLDGGLPRWMFPLPVVRDVEITTALAGLLDALSGKSCTHLTLNCWETTIPNISTPRPLRTLQALTIRSLLLFFSTFRNWTVTSINISPVTELILTEPTLPSSYWAEILPLLSSTTLIHLVIQTRALKAADLYPFLVRHPQLVELTLIQPLVITTDFAVMPKDALPRVVDLLGHPQTISHFLAPKGSGPRVEQVALGIELTKEATARELASNFAQMDSCLTRLARRTKLTRLILSFAEAAHAIDWLRGGGVPGLKRKNVESSLIHVKDITINTARAPAYYTSFAGAVPQWLALFPSLKSCTFVSCVPEDDRRRNAFLGPVSMLCPQIKRVTLDEKTYIINR